MGIWFVWSKLCVGVRGNVKSESPKSKFPSVPNVRLLNDELEGQEENAVIWFEILSWHFAERSRGKIQRKDHSQSRDLISSLFLQLWIILFLYFPSRMLGTWLVHCEKVDYSSMVRGTLIHTEFTGRINHRQGKRRSLKVHECRSNKTKD
jgi:hypothetical protein